MSEFADASAPPTEKRATINEEEYEKYCTDCVVVEPSPAEKILIPSDVVEINEGDEMVYIVGTRGGKVTVIDGLDHVKGSLNTLILRACLISRMDGLTSLVLLTKLELYDNQIEEITGIQTLTNLTILDLSFNCIRSMAPVHQCPLLEELYLAQNKLRKIEGLEGLVHLKILDLGANRIRTIEGLEKNTSLKSLWLGKNKIEEIQGLDSLKELTQLDIQSNRIITFGTGLKELRCLSEFYMAHNAIGNLDGLPLYDSKTGEVGIINSENDENPLLRNSSLSTIDLSSNKLSSLAGIEKFSSLEEFWMSSNLFETYESLGPLCNLSHLHCVYLEHSPIAKDFEYRKTLAVMIPSLEQLDATNVSRNK